MATSQSGTLRRTRARRTGWTVMVSTRARNAGPMIPDVERAPARTSTSEPPTIATRAIRGRPGRRGTSGTSSSDAGGWVALSGASSADATTAPAATVSVAVGGASSVVAAVVTAGSVPVGLIACPPASAKEFGLLAGELFLGEHACVTQLAELLELVEHVGLGGSSGSRCVLLRRRCGVDLLRGRPVLRRRWRVGRRRTGLRGIGLGPLGGGVRVALGELVGLAALDAAADGAGGAGHDGGTGHASE